MVRLQEMRERGQKTEKLGGNPNLLKKDSEKQISKIETHIIECNDDNSFLYILGWQFVG